MKSLYFVGNEELWNDAWFLALVESLSKRALNVALLDIVKDVPAIKNAAEELSAYNRMIFFPNSDPEGLLLNMGVSVSKDNKSLLYVFSEIVNPSANPRQVGWGVSDSELLKTIGLWEASQVIEEAFLFDLNLANEVSKAIEKNEDSMIDSRSLAANADEISQLLEIDPQTSKLIKVEGIKIADHKTVIQPLETKIKVIEDEVVKHEPTVLVHEDQRSVLSFREESEVAIKVHIPDEVVAPANKVEDISFDEFKSDAIKVESIELDDVPPVAPKVVKIDEPQNIPPVIAGVEVSQLISAMSQAVPAEDLDVIKRYAGIKERELRESLATSEALRRQLRYFDERVKKSEEERRRLLLKLEETENELRTVADKKDENKVHLKNIEQRYEEKIKELLIQLESSQFQAGKLDKKLIDFRERVRNDLQKIRTRERELASRLEIQKRDAEALLSAKDERLLNQKREVDRLEFELDSLRERLYDDAQKNEERRKRVARALQSLKLAQSILSGLEEDTSAKDEKEKAA